MQLADLVDEQDAAVSLGYCSWLRLGDSCYAHGARALVDRVVDGADQRIGNAAFVKAGGGCINFRKFGILTEGRGRILLGFA
ncbi:hypothetical protein D3C71_1914790 [compost metagenome]